MPLRIIKRIKRFGTKNHQDEYAKGFGIDFEHLQTWKYYSLKDRELIHCTVSKLLDNNGRIIEIINDHFELETDRRDMYRHRGLYLPKDLVLDYGIEEGMILDLVLLEVLRKQGDKTVRIPIYPKRLIVGPMDITPRDDKSTGTLSSGLSPKEYDVFICHASEDKETFVRELAKGLSGKGLKVWYDEFTLSLGDSLRRKIDHGLANSRYGVVILSKSFFEKDWPQKELDGLIAKERDGKKVILPIWHGVTREDVESFSPILAGRVAASTHKGIDYVVKEIIRAIRQS